MSNPANLLFNSGTYFSPITVIPDTVSNKPTAGAEPFSRNGTSIYDAHGYSGAADVTNDSNDLTFAALGTYYIWAE